MNTDFLLNDNKTLYDVLDISPSATHEEISQTHRKLVLRYHPDKLKEPSDEDILEYSRIQKAYQFLADDDFRMIYKKNKWNFRKSKEQFEKNQTKLNENDDDLKMKSKIHSIDLNLTTEELMSGGTFKLEIPIYNNTYYPLIKKLVNVTLEPNVFPKSVIHLSNVGLESINIQLNPISYNKKHTSPIYHYIKYSYKLLGLNNIKLKLTVPMVYLSGYLWNTNLNNAVKDYEGTATAYVYIKLPNKKWMELPYSIIINNLIAWTERNDSDISDIYYCLSGLGLKSYDGTLGNMYIQFSFDTLKYPICREGTKYDTELNNLIKNIKEDLELIKVSFNPDKENFFFKKSVEEKAYQEKEQYLIAQRITCLDSVSITPVV